MLISVPCFVHVGLFLFLGALSLEWLTLASEEECFISNISKPIAFLDLSPCRRVIPSNPTILGRKSSTTVPTIVDLHTNLEVKNCLQGFPTQMHPSLTVDQIFCMCIILEKYSIDPSKKEEYYNLRDTFKFGKQLCLSGCKKSLCKNSFSSQMEDQSRFLLNRKKRKVHRYTEGLPSTFTSSLPVGRLSFVSKSWSSRRSNLTREQHCAYRLLILESLKKQIYETRRDPIKGLLLKYLIFKTKFERECERHEDDSTEVSLVTESEDLEHSPTPGSVDVNVELDYDDPEDLNNIEKLVPTLAVNIKVKYVDADNKTCEANQSSTKEMKDTISSDQLWLVIVLSILLIATILGVIMLLINPTNNESSNESSPKEQTQKTPKRNDRKRPPPICCRSVPLVKNKSCEGNKTHPNKYHTSNSSAVSLIVENKKANYHDVNTSDPEVQNYVAKQLRKSKDSKSQQYNHYKDEKHEYAVAYTPPLKEAANPTYYPVSHPYNNIRGSITKDNQYSLIHGHPHQTNQGFDTTRGKSFYERAQGPYSNVEYRKLDLDSQYNQSRYISQDNEKKSNKKQDSLYNQSRYISQDNEKKSNKKTDSLHNQSQFVSQDNEKKSNQKRDTVLSQDNQSSRYRVLHSYEGYSHIDNSPTLVSTQDDPLFTEKDNRYLRTHGSLTNQGFDTTQRESSFDKRIPEPQDNETKSNQKQYTALTQDNQNSRYRVLHSSKGNAHIDNYNTLISTKEDNENKFNQTQHTALSQDNQNSRYRVLHSSEGNAHADSSHILVSTQDDPIFTAKDNQYSRTHGSLLLNSQDFDANQWKSSFYVRPQDNENMSNQKRDTVLSQDNQNSRYRVLHSSKGNAHADNSHTLVSTQDDPIFTAKDNQYSLTRRSVLLSDQDFDANQLKSSIYGRPQDNENMSNQKRDTALLQDNQNSQYRVLHSSKGNAHADNSPTLVSIKEDPIFTSAIHINPHITDLNQAVNPRKYKTYNNNYQDVDFAQFDQNLPFSVLNPYKGHQSSGISSNHLSNMKEVIERIQDLNSNVHSLNQKTPNSSNQVSPPLTTDNSFTQELRKNDAANDAPQGSSHHSQLQASMPFLFEAKSSKHASKTLIDRLGLNDGGEFGNNNISDISKNRSQHVLTSQMFTHRNPSVPPSKKESSIFGNGEVGDDWEVPNRSPKRGGSHPFKNIDFPIPELNPPIPPLNPEDERTPKDKTALASCSSNKDTLQPTSEILQSLASISSSSSDPSETNQETPATPLLATPNATPQEAILHLYPPFSTRDLGSLKKFLTQVGDKAHKR